MIDLYLCTHPHGHKNHAILKKRSCHRLIRVDISKGSA